MIPSEPQHSTVDQRERVLRWGALGLIVLVLFFRLSARSITETSEARYAETAREMLERGDMVTPRLFELKHLSKPPLTYWLTAAGYLIFGVNEMGARFFLALAALGTVLATWSLGSLLAGGRAGPLAALILATCPLFSVLGRLLTTDMFLCLWVTLGITAFIRAARSRGEPGPWHLLFWTCMGLLFLTKGPVGLLIVACAVVPGSWCTGRKQLFRWLRPGRGVWLMVLIGLPWYVLVCWRTPGLLEYFLIHQLFERVATTVHNRSEPFWFFVPVLMLGTLPWTAWLPGMARSWLARNPLLAKGPEGDDPQALVAGWFGLPFLLFSLSGSKLPTYVLPCLPPLAIVLAAYVDRIMDRPTAALDRIATLLTALTLTLALGWFTWFHGEPGFSGLRPHLSAGVMVLAVWTALASTANRRPTSRALVGATLAAALVLPLLVIPYTDRAESHFKGLRRLAHLAAQHLGPGGQMVLCRFSASSFPFYLERPVLTFDCWHEYRFDDDPNAWKQWHFYEMERLLRMLGSNEPHVMLADEESFQEISETYAREIRGPPLQVLGRQWKFILFKRPSG